MMEQQHQVDCKVAVDPQEALGTFANAFRVMEDETGRCLMEFLVYSSTEKRAAIVRRVVVQPNFLPLIVQRMSDSLDPIDPHGFTST